MYCHSEQLYYPGPTTVQLSVIEEEKEGGDLPVTGIEAIKCHQELEVRICYIMTVDMEVDT